MTSHRNTESPIFYYSGDNVETLRQSIENNARYQVWNANIVRSMIEVWGTTVQTQDQKPTTKRISKTDKREPSEEPDELPTAAETR